MRPDLIADLILSNAPEPIALDPWQRFYLRDSSKLIAILKSRRVGGSWTMALKTFIRAMLKPDYHALFVSMNLDEARGKIDYIEQFHQMTPEPWRLSLRSRSRDEIVFADRDARRSVIRSLASKAPRGRGGDVGISELPHCQNAREIYEGALHCAAREEDDRVTVESTPLAADDIFHELTKGSRLNPRRYEIPWWLSSGLSTDLHRAAREAPLMTTAQRVELFGSRSLKTIYASMSEKSFQRESELLFDNDEESLFPSSLLLKSSEPDFGERAEGLRYIALRSVPKPTDWAWLKANAKGELIAGYDPARRRDKAALAIVDRIAPDRIELRMTATLAEAPFALQRSVLEGAIRSGARSIAIDATGIGLDLAERMESLHPEIARAVFFTARVKEALISSGWSAFNDEAITIPAARDLLDQFGAIRQLVSAAGNTIYKTERDSAGHQDMAWAILLAIRAARSTEPEKPRGAIEYESVIPRARRT